jgi:hypothetical protein
MIGTSPVMLAAGGMLSAGDRLETTIGRSARDDGGAAIRSPTRTATRLNPRRSHRSSGIISGKI